LLLVALPAIVLLSLLVLLNNGLIDFIVGLLVVAVCIGNPNARQLYRQYLNALGRKDEEAQFILQTKLAKSCEGYIPPNKEHDEQHQEQVEQAQALKQQQETLGETLIWINFRYYAAPIFYFVLLGVPGLVFYSTLLFLAEHSKANNAFSESQQQTLFKWLEWMFWLPSRLVSLGFMIVGHFSNGLETWLKYAANFSYPAREMLCKVALKSEQYGDSIERNNAQHMVKLTKRNMILFLVMVALLTLYGQII
jgi:AmpE protein